MAKKDTDDFIFWDKLKYVFSSPKMLFNSINKEVGIRDAFLTLLITGTAISVLFFIFSFGSIFISGKLIEHEISSSLIQIFGIFMLILVFSFVYSGLMDLALLVFTGKGNFSKMYRLYAYTSIPLVLCYTVPFLNILAVIYSIYLIVAGSRVLFKLGTWKAILIFILPALLLFLLLIGLVFFLYMGRFSF